MLRYLFCALAFLIPCKAVIQDKPLASENARLLAVGKLWVTVKYFHPYLAYRPIDWDKSLVDSLPSIRAAHTAPEYLQALNRLLDSLHDPGTYAHVEHSSESAGLILNRRADGTLVVSADAAAASHSVDLPGVMKALDSTTDVVFDLRYPSGVVSELLHQPSLSAQLSSGEVNVPGTRTWVHQGFSPPDGPMEAFYQSAFLVKAGSRVHGTATRKRKYTFLLGEGSELPAFGCALLAANDARVVTESAHYRACDNQNLVIPMGLGVTACISVAEPVFADGTGFPALPIADKALQMAMAQTLPQRTILPPFPILGAETYPQTRYPWVEYRILAAYKIWAVFHYFFAYRDLMDEDWDQVFEEFLPKIMDSGSAREYNLTLAQMLTDVADSHAFVHSAELDDYFGLAPVGLRLRLIDKKPIITEVLGEDALQAGLKPGDMVTKLDGNNLAERINEQARYIPASTQQSLRYLEMRRVLNGVDGSSVRLTVVGADKQARDVTLTRSRAYVAALRHQRTGAVVKSFATTIGYVDLDRLKLDEVDGMFDRLRDTKAIIFDMRGYPNGTAWSIAPRLTPARDVAAAIFTGPLTLTPDLPDRSAASQSASYFFVQTLPNTDKWRYKGRTIMLIDESTMSQAEHTGLFFEAANKTEFIGSPSAGANGDVSSFTVPGGMTISFSGHDVRHANGGQLQRLGLQPAITVEPTVNGIRAGRDEVLERALEYLTSPK